MRQCSSRRQSAGSLVGSLVTLSLAKYREARCCRQANSTMDNGVRSVHAPRKKRPTTSIDKKIRSKSGETSLSVSSRQTGTTATSTMKTTDDDETPRRRRRAKSTQGCRDFPSFLSQTVQSTVEPKQDSTGTAKPTKRLTSGISTRLSKQAEDVRAQENCTFSARASRVSGQLGLTEHSKKRVSPRRPTRSVAGADTTRSSRSSGSLESFRRRHGGDMTVGNFPASTQSSPRRSMRSSPRRTASTGDAELFDGYDLKTVVREIPITTPIRKKAIIGDGWKSPWEANPWDDQDKNMPRGGTISDEAGCGKGISTTTHTSPSRSRRNQSPRRNFSPRRIKSAPLTSPVKVRQLRDEVGVCRQPGGTGSSDSHHLGGLSDMEQNNETSTLPVRRSRTTASVLSRRTSQVSRDSCRGLGRQLSFTGREAARSLSNPGAASGATRLESGSRHTTSGSRTKRRANSMQHVAMSRRNSGSTSQNRRDADQRQTMRAPRDIEYDLEDEKPSRSCHKNRSTSRGGARLSPRSFGSSTTSRSPPGEDPTVDDKGPVFAEHNFETFLSRRGSTGDLHSGARTVVTTLSQLQRRSSTGGGKSSDVFHGEATQRQCPVQW